MIYSIIVHDLHEIEVFEDATEMINRIVEIMSDGIHKPTYLGIWENSFSIIFDIE